MTRPARSLLVLLLAAVRSSRSAAVAPPELNGFYKHLLSLTEVRDNFRALGLIDRDVEVDDIQRLRLQWEYTPRAWWDATVHYEVRAVWGDSVRLQRRVEEQAAGASDFLASTLHRAARPRFLDLEDTFVEESNVTLGQELDRLRLRLHGERVELAVGRQAVSWGSGLIWQPTDLFAAFAPDEIDRDQKLGIDVVRLMAHPTTESSVDLIAEPLDNESNYSVNRDDSSLAVRGNAHVGEYDLALVGGEIASDAVVGGDFSGYLGNAGFRGEWTYTWVAEADERDYFKGLLGLEYSFAARWDPYVAVEYFYNGLGEDNPDDYVVRLQDQSVRRVFDRGTAFNIGRHYLGAVLRLVPSALVTVQSLTVWNPGDGSALEFVTLSRSLSDNVELILGANVGLGPLGTEYGGFSKKQAGVDFATPDFCYAFLKCYF